MERQATLARDVRITPALFAPCYALLQATFHSAELQDAPSLLADLAAPVDPRLPEQFVMLGRSKSVETQEAAPEKVISLIAGSYLSLSNTEFVGLSLGFIEYLVTDRAYRQQGCASALLNLFEQEMAKIAVARGEQLTIILGEIESGLVSFKMRRGYRSPRGSRYMQPPIDFDPLTGVPLFPETPFHLMIKSWGTPVRAALLLRALQLIFQKRYVPKQLGVDAAQSALAYIMERVYTPFAASLCTQDGDVIF